MSDRTDNDFRIERPDQWLTNELDMRSYLRHKRRFEFLLVLVFCVLIFFLGYFCLIQGETIAAILGALVGYCFEHWRDKGKQI